MQEEVLRGRLKAIEAELTTSHSTAVLGGGTPEIALAILTRQTELLAEKARIQVNLGEDSAAVQTATEAERLAGSLRFHASRRSDANEAIPPVSDDLAGRVSAAAATAKTSRALAHVALGNLAEARALLGQLHTGLGSDTAIDEVEHALRREVNDRFDLVEREISEHSGVTQVQLAQHWGEAEQQLTEIAELIATKVVEAGNLVQRTVHPDRFVHWLSNRIDSNVRKLRAAETAAVDAHTGPLLVSAVARGEEFRRQVFESDEVLAASALSPNTDDLLKLHRDEGWLIALQHPDDPSRFGYPRWQFNKIHQSLVIAIWRKLHAVDPWGRWIFFHTPSSRLHYLTPLQALGIEQGQGSLASPSFGRPPLAGTNLELALRSAADDYLTGEE